MFVDLELSDQDPDPGFFDKKFKKVRDTSTSFCGPYCLSGSEYSVGTPDPLTRNQVPHITSLCRSV
jgi:hypothetical protein